MKKITITFLAASLLSISGVIAQTIQDGMNDLYAERYKNAIDNFEKLLTVNPNNIEATYWLGQTYLGMDEIAGERREKAKQLYEKALQTTQNAPLILVGIGHVELLENKTSDARLQFEAALTASRSKKGDDPEIQTAIGRANVDAKAGDFNYAIQLLEAATAKDPKNTETLLQLGNAYRKAKPGEGGGQAYQTYLKALQVDPKFAVADLRLAKLFESQRNWELVLQYLNEAVTRDSKFAAAYYELFYYYFARKNFPEAEAQLTKYIDSKAPETDIQDQYLYAQLSWVRKDFDLAITKAESVVTAMGNLTKPKVYRLLADAYNEKGDYTNAKKYSDLFFAKKNPEDVILPDYETRAAILSKMESTPDEVYNTYIAGVSIDTTIDAKVEFLKKGADFFKAKGDSISRLKEGDIRLAILKLKPDPSQRDYFDAGFAFYQGKDLTRSDSIFIFYTQKWPDEPFGWRMDMEIKRLIDTSMALGLAVPPAIKYLEILEKDTAKNKKSIIGVAAYLAQYYANIAKDKEKAIVYLEKMVLLDPTNDTYRKYLDDLKKSSQKTSNSRSNPPAPKAMPDTKTIRTGVVKT